MESRSMRWSQLVVLMALGEGPETLVHGTVSATSVGVESTYRVWAHGERVRRERLDGSISSLAHGSEFWLVEPGASVALHHPALHLTFPDRMLTYRRPLREWSHDDYTRPAGPIEPVEHLGRAAWRVEVAPPRSKAHALTLVVDDETGHVLSALSAGGDGVAWQDDLVVGGEVDPDVFTWSGPTRPYVP